MKPTPPAAQRVGVRELRQNLSVYLAQVAEGSTFEVTDHGRPVALLVPLRPGATVAERLVASGRARPAGGDLLALERPHARLKRSASEALAGIREDRL
ncbi:MAG TPA: type II toxin-antitoxin system prevent-host-death family antitoxin [Vicinamibacterales bacterium]|nr:type II toxin-antitoxin system prevent-host-death family antitoxin [Vicinamibacterales bacterium]